MTARAHHRLVAQVVAVGALLGVLTVAAPAHARRTRFGLGVVLGKPTGLSGEMVFGPRTSMDMTVGLDTFDDGAVYLGLDYLIRLVDVNRGGSVGMPLYIGFGGFLVDTERGEGGRLLLGPRIPFGIQFDFRSAPLVLFAELAVRFVVIAEDDVGKGSDLHGNLGLRVYF